MFHEWINGDLILRVKVQPKASKDEFCDELNERLKIRITAPPIDGKANQHLIKFLARQFKVSKAHIKLLSGESHREKRIKIIQPEHIPKAIEHSVSNLN